MIWFTADQHFAHHNILEYANRPFPDVLQMHMVIMRNFLDRVVANDDVVYDLGDFALTGSGSRGTAAAHIEAYLQSMPVDERYLVRGNHDHRRVVQRCSWDAITHPCDTLRIKSPSGLRLQLQHRPVPWNARGRYEGQVDAIIHGHNHVRKGMHVTRLSPSLVQINVGVDAWDFTPVSMTQIEKILENELAFA